MKVYSGENIRNVAILGHGGTGKTSLTAAMLYLAGATPRLGRVDDGSTLTDWDEEEIARKISISTGLAYAEWAPRGRTEKIKVNLLDTPGYNIFINETKATLLAADAGLILVDAVAGSEVVTEKVWDYCTEYDLPRAFMIHKMDRELAGFERATESIHQVYGRGAVAVQLPIGQEKNFKGLVNLIAMKAYTYVAGGEGKYTESEIPAELAEKAKDAHEKLVEMVAEGDDKLMEEFFDKGTLEPTRLQEGLRQAIAAKRIFPMLIAAGLPNIGAENLLNFICDFLPSPLARGKIIGAAEPGGGETVERKIADSEPLSIYVFKTLADPFAGRITYFKVMSGVLKNDATLQNFNRNTAERFQHVEVRQGKTPSAVAELRAGDIGTVAKLKETTTGDTLGDKAAPIFYKPARIPEPSISFAIEPKTRADEDRLSQALHRILEEDLALRYVRDAQTKEFLLAGSGQQHVEVAVAKLKKRYNVDVALKAPKVPYRETIRGKADVEGRHKKQTGGHGQFGVCLIKVEPLPRGSGFEFVSKIVGGSVPREYFKPVEEGIREAMEGGVLAGYELVDIRALLVDGSYHEVDSSELAFKIAASMGFKEAVRRADPVLMEPVMSVEVVVPEEYMGDLIGDLNARRGHIESIEARAGSQIIRASVPLAEMFGYATEMRSRTQGRATYTMHFARYEETPAAISEEIIAKLQGRAVGR